MGADAVDLDLAGAAAAVGRGEVIAVPTDTVYGLVCDPRRRDAVDRVYALKRRPAGLELTLLAASAADLAGLVAWNEPAMTLAARHWPGPLSLVLPVGEVRLAVPRSATTLSVRVPDHRALLALLGETGPLASTSANRHGETPALTGPEVRVQFGAGVAVVAAGDGSRPGGMASTIIDCSVTPPRVLREGPIAGHGLAAPVPD